jgi:hypothetical protein
MGSYHSTLRRFTSQSAKHELGVANAVFRLFVTSNLAAHDEEDDIILKKLAAIRGKMCKMGMNCERHGLARLFDGHAYSFGNMASPVPSVYGSFTSSGTSPEPGAAEEKSIGASWSNLSLPSPSPDEIHEYSASEVNEDIDGRGPQVVGSGTPFAVKLQCIL